MRLNSLNSKQKLGFFVLLLFIVLLPLVIIIAGKRQEIRQRASGSEATLYFSTGASTVPATSSKFILNQPKTLSLFLDTGENAANGFEAVINIGNPELVNIERIDDGSGAEKFESDLIKEINQTAGTIHFAKSTTNTANIIKGKLLIGLLKLTPKKEGSSQVQITNSIVLKPQSRDPLTSSSAPLSYTVSQPQGPQGRMFLANANGAELNQINLQKGQETSLFLYLDSGSTAVTSFDTVINLSNFISKINNLQFTEGIDAGKFERDVVKNLDQETGILNFARASASTTPISGKLLLGSFNFKVKDNAPSSSGIIPITKSEVTMDPRGQMNISTTDVSYNIQGDAVSPTISPSVSPNPSLSPEVSPSVSPEISPTAAPSNLRTYSYCGSGNTQYTSFTKFSWDSASGANDYKVSYKLNVENVQEEPYSGPYSTGGRLSYTAPREGSCPGEPNEAGSGYFCGFPYNSQFAWKVSAVDSSGITGGEISGRNFETAGCPSATASLDLIFSGIGAGRGNTAPLHKEKTVSVCVYTTDTDPTGDFECAKGVKSNGPVAYDVSSGNYKADVFDLGESLEGGDYYLYIKADGYLRKKIPPVVALAKGQKAQAPQIALTAGDINNDNSLNVQDYEMWRSCYGTGMSNTQDCQAADLNDDGKNDSPTDLSDFKLLYETFQHQRGN